MEGTYDLDYYHWWHRTNHSIDYWRCNIFNSERTLVEERLGQYIDDSKDDVDSEAQKYVLTNWVSKRVEKTNFGDGIAKQLARADLKFKVAEYLVLILASIFVFALFAWFFGNQHPISALIGGLNWCFCAAFLCGFPTTSTLTKI
ncbi:MAG: hypothetical protein HC797_07140 [Anaerolineales bacterium]|nr:hypothetical protein [Anaerolineales bacterium]